MNEFYHDPEPTPPEWVETYEDYLEFMAAHEHDNPPEPPKD